MPKPITIEMLRAMAPDQRKTLQKNAAGLDTSEARAVLELLAQHDLLAAPRVAAKHSARKSRKPEAKPSKGAVAKPTKAIYGRQA